MCDYCSWIETILHPKIEDLPTVCADFLGEEEEEQIEPETPVKKYVPTILVHGTAVSVATREEISATLERIEKAAIEAYKELAKGCEAIEAVELAILNLESTEFNSDGGEPANMLKGNNLMVIRDAAIMDSESNAGFFGAATHTIHPITKAKNVLQEATHVLIVESGLEMSSNNLAHADKFNKILPTPPNSRMSAEDIEETKKINEANLSAHKGITLYGAVARDRKGHLTCGISTMDDREESIAKSSMTASGTVLGCGIFANAKACCSVSSEDRAIYLYAPARKIAERLRQEKGAKKDLNALIKIEDVLNCELNNFFKDTGESCIGAAALTLEGEPKVAFTSEYFPWACCNDGIITSGYMKGEIFEKDVGELDMPLDCICD